VKEWITGRNPVYETLRAKRRHVFRLMLLQGIKLDGHLPEILRMAKERKVQVLEAQRPQLDAIDRHNQGIALEASEYPYAALEDLFAHAEASGEAPFFLLLDLIPDPQNLGSLLRTADLMGVHGVVIPSSQAALITPAVVHASSGGSEHLLIAQYNLAQAIDRMKQLKDVWVYGLDASPKARPIQQLRLNGGVALVVGNEGEGLRDLVRNKCDDLLRLPQYGQLDSLNAAVAGSIALFLARQARQIES
jgi:23S rRNA (guanosine2251-2'-O)-methyltransferase